MTPPQSETLDRIRNLIQQDVGHRGLATDPVANLITACPGDFAAACESLAKHPAPAVAIVTGFFIPDAEPPAGETDGPLGALYLARGLVWLGMRVTLLSDDFCMPALMAGMKAFNLHFTVPLGCLPHDRHDWPTFLAQWLAESRALFGLSHLVAIERPGPSHTAVSVRQQKGASADMADFLRDVPPERQDRYHTASGKDITGCMSPAHLLFESVHEQLEGATTIGIGDGGNEIGMGKIAWDVIRRNISRGGLIACRTPVDHLIVSGVSNWGAYALTAGVALLRGIYLHDDVFGPERERQLLELMVSAGPLVDGVTKKPSVSVDGLGFDAYIEPLRRIAALLGDLWYAR